MGCVPGQQQIEPEDSRGGDAQADLQRFRNDIARSDEAFEDSRHGERQGSASTGLVPVAGRRRLIPAFAVAGIFEGFVTPSDVIPESLKVGLGVAAAAIFWLYLLLAGHTAHPEAP